MAKADHLRLHFGSLFARTFMFMEPSSWPGLLGIAPCPSVCLSVCLRADVIYTYTFVAFSGEKHTQQAKVH